MFGGVAASVNGHIFAGLFGRSTMLLLPEPLRGEALALEGAGPFDPMGDGRLRSDKVMLPEGMMDEPDELRAWIARAFDFVVTLPAKPPKAKSANPPSARANLVSAKAKLAKKKLAKAPRKPALPAVTKTKARARR
jgi:hypothetical protein